MTDFLQPRRFRLRGTHGGFAVVVLDMDASMISSGIRL